MPSVMMIKMTLLAKTMSKKGEGIKRSLKEKNIKHLKMIHVPQYLMVLNVEDFWGRDSQWSDAGGRRL